MFQIKIFGMFQTYFKTYFYLEKINLNYIFMFIQYVYAFLNNLKIKL